MRISRHVTLISLALLIFMAGMIAVYAHNNATVHPDITHAAMDLVKTLDEQQSEVATGQIGNYGLIKYQEVEEFRGTQRSAAVPRIATQVEDHSNFTGIPRDSIVKGVVFEDDPVARVVNHFYHARTGIPLSGTWGLDSSSKRARYLFSIGLDMFGYTQQSKERAFYYFGRSLHHLQDMSSPAHVHDDAHLITLAETDDYEGRWVPFKLWLTAPATLNSLLGAANNIENIQDWGKVWDVPTDTIAAENSLAGYTFNRATYLATLEFPFLIPPNAPTGELAEMFPCNDGARPNNCLHWEWLNLLGKTSWTIDSVGYFNYQVIFSGSTDAWWAVNWNDGDSSTNLPVAVQGEYYIEQLIPGTPAKTVFTAAVVPTRYRQDFTSYWNAATNPTINNATSEPLVKIRAEHLLTPAVSYSAGFVQWWYDIANTPPYLKRVTAMQGSSIKYDAEWQDKPTIFRPDIVLDEVPFGDSVTEQILVVPGRNLVPAIPEYKYINDKATLELWLEFNEGVSGPSIEVDVDGKNILVDGGSVSNVTPVDLDASTNDPAQMNRRWKFDIPKENISNMNGKLVLTVKAVDINNHWQNIGGDLDETPGTPAKRQMPVASQEDITYTFPWHTTSTVGVDGKVGSNAYEFSNGDRNHYLLFDSIPPTVNTNIQMN